MGKKPWYKGGQTPKGGGTSVGKLFKTDTGTGSGRQTNKTHGTDRRTGQGGNSGRGGR